MDNNFVLKLKSANLEIEISGPEKEFVAERFKEIMERLEELEIEESTIFQNAITKAIPAINPQNQQISSATISTTEIQNAPTVNQPESESGLIKLARDAGITEIDLRNIYDLKDGRVYIHKLIDGQAESDKQKKVTKLALIANEYILGKGDLSGKALGAYMRELGIGNMGNLATNLKSDSGIYRLGNSYKLNQQGRASALTLIKELAV